MANETINVLTFADEAYVQHAGVLIHSLDRASRRSEPVHCILLTTELSYGSKAKLEHLQCQLNSLRLTVREMRQSALGSLDPKKKGISRNIYYKLDILEYVPTSLERILVVDADSVVRRNPHELFEIDLHDYYLGAVAEPYRVVGRPEDREIIGLSPEMGYFNSGVMVLNLHACRRDRVFERAADFAMRYNLDTLYHDQDALNHAVAGNWMSLSPKWNTVQWVIRRGRLKGDLHRRPRIQSRARYLRKNSPSIIHFSGPAKPWLYLPEPQYKWLYWRHLKQTPWAGYVPPDRSLLSRIGKPFYRVFVLLRSVLSVLVKRAFPGQFVAWLSATKRRMLQGAAILRQWVGKPIG